MILVHDNASFPGDKKALVIVKDNTKISENYEEFTTKKYQDEICRVFRKQKRNNVLPAFSSSINYQSDLAT